MNKDTLGSERKSVDDQLYDKMKEVKSFSAQIKVSSEDALREFVEAAIREEASLNEGLKSQIQDHKFKSRLTARLCVWLKLENRVVFGSEKKSEDLPALPSSTLVYKKQPLPAPAGWEFYPRTDTRPTTSHCWNCILERPTEEDSGCDGVKPVCGQCTEKNIWCRWSPVGLFSTEEEKLIFGYDAEEYEEEEGDEGGDEDEDEEVMMMEDEEEDTKKCWGGRRGW